MAKRLSKKVAKIEKKADRLRKRAEKKGHELQHRASDKVDELQGRKKRGKKGIVAAVLAVGAAVGLVAKRKRDQELDDSLWEEPKSL
jgi:hypothetical protein